MRTCDRKGPSSPSLPLQAAHCHRARHCLHRARATWARSTRAAAQGRKERPG